ncbi:hypothetical protein N3K66_000521 [Trichothecium roseum]|uniref:Uncharacterized protein n=1 Tax=Trichothecium roseum TaxID=47278 RepID=A0ACC0VC84_9HYPO|nr:hypothetical protein N3K66_000521 [Trichothecium roseum]
MINLTVWHFAKNAFLLWLSLFLLPASTAFVVLVDLRSKLFRHGAVPSPTTHGRKTVLVTGVNMAKGLALARMFHLRGHRVIGADHHALSLGLASRSIHKFYRLPNVSEAPPIEEQDPYIDRLVSIVKAENVDLWISVSGVDAAVRDARAAEAVEIYTHAKAVQFKEADVRSLDSKDWFIKHVEELGLLIPETRSMDDKAELTKFLSDRSGLSAQPNKKLFIIKPSGVDDIHRFDMPLLPLATEEQTLAAIESLPLAKGSFVVQEFIHGHEFCTHALIVRGRVRAFVACPSSAVLMHYAALPMNSDLGREMLTFTEKVAAAGGHHFTGHLSFDFLVKANLPWEDFKEDKEVKLYPIECNPRVHTAVVLFNDTPKLVDEYLSALRADSYSEVTGEELPLSPKTPHIYYWSGQDLVENGIYPLVQILTGNMTVNDCWTRLKTFSSHVMESKDGTFETWDPWPWWWLYHVYWPAQFASYLFAGRWSQVNVSTGKAFRAN